ncbi:MAG TPA: ABC transporter ATP-binding protein, partial [Pseudomonadota bacterium]|nr:ABC transporter ATP-binding protein [Pseudomonadota bacterium]
MSSASPEKNASPSGPAERPAATGKSAPGKASAPTTAEAKLRAFHEEDAVKSGADFRNFLRLWPFVRPHLRPLLLSLMSLVALAGLGLFRPLLMGQVVSHAAAKQPDALFRDGLLLTG